MADKWVSKGLYEHPVKHQKGVFGNIAKSEVGVYVLRVGASHMSCPQEWAAKIEADETNATTMAIRDVPESLRMQLRSKALAEGKTMQVKIIELMQEYVSVKV